MENVYEIKLYGSWHEVTEWTFRSWGGPRKINGELYEGPVFYLGSEEIVKSHRGKL